MSEEFLHYIWQFKRFKFDNLYTTDQVKIVIHKSGERNTNAGPDFCNALISIGNTKWAGNIEIHINASDWAIHQHQLDKAYDNVILHVVYNDDKPIYRNNGEPIPTLVLKGLYNEAIYQKYLSFLNNKQWIPCLNIFKQLDKFIVENWLSRLYAERAERKANEIIITLGINKNNLEEAFYFYLARNFGLGLNALPFELLAKSLPILVLAKHKHDLFQTEALLFGQAGFLNKNFRDEYPQTLKKEYSFLQKKYALKSIDNSLWKFLRLRPSNFPTVRIAQFAALIYQSSGLFSKIIEKSSIADIMRYFDIQCSEYWKYHYHFEKETPPKDKKIGEATKLLILINTIAPFLFVYGIIKNEEDYKERAIAFMEKSKPEQNSIVKKWKQTGIVAKNAAQSQALIELKNNYCSAFKCLQCSIGIQLLKS